MGHVSVPRCQQLIARCSLLALESKSFPRMHRTDDENTSAAAAVGAAARAAAAELGLVDKTDDIEADVDPSAFDTFCERGTKSSRKSPRSTHPPRSTHRQGSSRRRLNALSYFSSHANQLGLKRTTERGGRRFTSRSIIMLTRKISGGMKARRMPSRSSQGSREPKHNNRQSHATLMLQKVHRRRASVFEAEDVRHSTPAWMLCVGIGVSVGFVDGFMVKTLSWLAELKHNLLTSAIDVSLPVAGIVMLAFCAALTFAVMFTVVKFAPMAVGSGLSEIKALLNGSNIPGLLDVKTGVVKCLGIMGTMTAGLALGREGPMVHIGTALAAFWLRIPYFKKNIVEPHTYRRAQSVINVKAEDLNLYLTIGGAAGVAAAFNAPITGVIYMLEEMASYWPTWMTVQAFACTAFAAVTMQVINYGYDNVGGDTNALLHPKGVVLATNWDGMDMTMFVVLGLLAGLFSTILIICCKFVFSLRAALVKRYKAKFIALDVLLLTTLAVTTYVFIPLAFECKPDPTHVVSSGPHRQLLTGAPPVHPPPYSIRRQRHLAVSAEVHHLQHTCGEGEYNPMADFTQGNSEHLVVTLWTEGVHFDKAILAVFLVVYAFQFMLLPGVKLPIGTFAPCLLMGALLGRLMGEVLHEWKPGYWADPGVFSQVAAGAMLSGYTHMALTITAIIIEASGASDLVVPVCVTVLVSRSVSVKMAGHILDDFQMAKKKLYFLYGSVPESVRSKLASDVMMKCNDRRFITCGMCMSPIKTLSLLTKNTSESRKPVLNAFPVVVRQHVIGVVSIQMLMNALKQNMTRRRDIEGGTLAQFVLEVVAMQREEKRKESNGSRTNSFKRIRPPEKRKESNGSRTNSFNRTNSFKRIRPPAPSKLLPLKREPLTPPLLTPLNAIPRSQSDSSAGSSASMDGEDGAETEAEAEAEVRAVPAAVAVSKKARFQLWSSMRTQSLNVAGMMDAAPIFFMEKTPVNRIYTAFIRMNLEMVCIVDKNQKLQGVITRKMLIEYPWKFADSHAHAGILYKLDKLRNSWVWWFEQRIMDLDDLYDAFAARCCPSSSRKQQNQFARKPYKVTPDHEKGFVSDQIPLPCKIPVQTPCKVIKVPDQT